jgi:protein deglycase
MVFIHLADGFEELEAVTAITVLRRAGIEAATVSVSSSRTVSGARGIQMIADLLIKDADYKNCEMIVLPGGALGTANLGKSTLLIVKIKEFAAAGKWLAAICMAPVVFGQSGILAGHKATVYPGNEAALGGAQTVSDRVVISDRIITSQGPGTALDFAFAIVDILKGEAAVNKVKGQMLIE